MNITKIRLTGGYFKTPKEFELFRHQKQIAAVVYGKNGSGKSSIARGFQEALSPTDNEESSEKEFTSIEFFKRKPHPQQDSEYVQTSEISIPCYVHNENFTNKTVSFNEDGLETIVMFGEQIDIQKELDILNEKLNKTQINYDTSKKLLDEQSDPKNQKSYLYFRDQITKKLRKDWAVRHQKIKGTKTLGKVSNTLLNEIINSPDSNDSYEELINEFNIRLDNYQKVQTTSPLNIIENISLPSSVTQLMKLLKIELEQPVLSEKEEKILKVYSTLNSYEIGEATNFLQSDKDICPLCFQNVEHQHKSNVLETIRKILNTADANKLVNKLSKIILEPYKLDLSKYESIINESLINKIKQNIEIYNEIIEQLEFEKQNKINNPYSPIYLDLDLNEVINKINDNIKFINIKIEKFNQEIKSKKKLEENLSEINKKLAYLECKYLIIQYKKRYDDYLHTKNETEKHLKTIEEIKNGITEKKASLANVNIALELINNYLEYIFYDDKRLYLIPSDDTYKVMSRDQPVKPSSLSVGEKNIISLCYFFSTLFQNQSINELFKNECILILDDPVSSFDFDNKVGVYSFLRYILNELHKGNPNSKSIIFTHDLDVLYNISKVYNDINISNRNNKLKLFYLYNQEIKDINTENYDEYSILLQNAYNFAAGHSNDSINIGNNLRRILEAYATFNYKCGIEQFTRNKEVLSKLPDNTYRDYFQNSMYRLVLNTESHLKERSRLLLSNSFKEHFSLDEKIRTAKDILMFLYLLDDVHLKFHLKEDSDDLVEFKIEKIKSWIDQVFNKAKVKT